MKYELAKQLKDAEFPQNPIGSFIVNTDVSTEPLSEPTLSELIEACGGRVGIFVFDDGTANAWKQVYNRYDLSSSEEDIQTYGSTSEEAVANLWLALNKKDA